MEVGLETSIRGSGRYGLDVGAAPSDGPCGLGLLSDWQPGLASASLFPPLFFPPLVQIRTSVGSGGGCLDKPNSRFGSTLFVRLPGGAWQGMISERGTQGAAWIQCCGSVERGVGAWVGAGQDSTRKGWYGMEREGKGTMLLSYGYGIVDCCRQRSQGRGCSKFQGLQGSKVPRFQCPNDPMFHCSKDIVVRCSSDWIMATTAMARQHWQCSAGSWLHSEVYVGGKEETALLLQPLAPPG